MKWDVHPNHLEQFKRALAYAEQRTGVKYKGKRIRYVQVSSPLRQGRWYYVERPDGRVSWWAAPNGTITQIVGPQGQHNPQFDKSARHEIGHLIAFQTKVQLAQHHEWLRARGLDYVRSQ